MKKVSKSGIETQDFKKMIALGRTHLEKNADYVNSLNVFPVPDGDTGINMSLSLNSGAQAVKDSTATSAGELSQALAKGLLMGARGNSGVILSQLFRGFSQALKDVDVIDAQHLAKAFLGGVDSAYKAVMKPVEGTILTVARESAKAGERKANETDDVLEVMETVLENAKKALKKTPDLLPVLKEVGVVDSGGQGLVYIYEGFYAALSGETLEDLEEDQDLPDLDELIRAEHHRDVHNAVNTEDIEFGYCTEIMVRIGEGDTVKEEFDYDTFRNHLNEMGDSLLVVADEEVVKVHVHTEHPGEVLNYGQRFGHLIKIKSDNMREQHSELVRNSEQAAPKKAERKEYGVIAISVGEGIGKLFESLGVDFVLAGGQTMNPSTEDILKAIDEVNADKVIILPNNKNIFMAAEQAALVSESEAVMIPTRTISQGLSAMLGFNPSNDLEQNKEEMTEEIEYVTSGQVTHAVRDTQIEGVEIKEGEFMGIIDGDIKVSEADKAHSSLETLKLMLTEDSEIVTILYGEDSTKEEAEQLAKKIEELYPDVELEIHNGGQPVYPYFFSVE